MKKIAKILSLSILAVALFVGCSNPADPDTTDTSDTTPKKENTDNGSKDNADNNGSGNGSDNNGSNEGNDSGNEENGPKLTKTDLGLSSTDGWGMYSISDASVTSVTVSYTDGEGKDNCCGADITFGKTTKVEFDVTNNEAAEAWLQIAIKKDGGKMAITSATVNEVACSDVTWGAATTIAANATVHYVINIDNTVGADKFVICFNSNKDKAENPATGSITISKAYKYE